MLPPHLNPRAKIVTPRAAKLAIIARVASAHGVSVREIMQSAWRDHRIVRARWAAIREVNRLHPRLTSVQLGHIFKLDHTTILNAFGRLRSTGRASPLV